MNPDHKLTSSPSLLRYCCGGEEVKRQLTAPARPLTYLALHGRLFRGLFHAFHSRFLALKEDLTTHGKCKLDFDVDNISCAPCHGNDSK